MHKFSVGTIFLALTIFAVNSPRAHAEPPECFELFGQFDSSDAHLANANGKFLNNDKPGACAEIQRATDELAARRAKINQFRKQCTEGGLNHIKDTVTMQDMNEKNAKDLHSTIGCKP